MHGLGNRNLLSLHLQQFSLLLSSSISVLFFHLSADPRATLLNCLCTPDLFLRDMISQLTLKVF